MAVSNTLCLKYLELGFFAIDASRVGWKPVVLVAMADDVDEASHLVIQVPNIDIINNCKGSRPRAPTPLGIRSRESF